MKIVVLDGYTLNPGDISWAELEKFGTLTVHDRIAFDTNTIIETIGDAEIVFTNKTPLQKDVLDKLSLVKYIGVLATGYNAVDTIYAKTRGITVTNIPAYSTEAVAQFAIGLILEMCHHIGEHNRSVKNDEWTNSPQFCYWNYPLFELTGKTLGIIGFGRIGQSTARIAQALGMKILAFGSRVKPELISETCKYAESLDELLQNSDIVSLHCPLFESTEGLINKNTIAKMKDGAMLVNTSRGQLIVEQDLADALNNRKLFGAALDVVAVEPIEASNPLLKAANCIITPHIAWAPKEARARLMNVAASNLKAFLDGQPINVV